jgi:hypothetical protein
MTEAPRLAGGTRSRAEIKQAGVASSQCAAEHECREA